MGLHVVQVVQPCSSAVDRIRLDMAQMNITMKLMCASSATANSATANRVLLRVA